MSTIQLNIQQGTEQILRADTNDAIILINNSDYVISDEIKIKIFGDSPTITNTTIVNEYDQIKLMNTSDLQLTIKGYDYRITPNFPIIRKSAVGIYLLVESLYPDLVIILKNLVPNNQKVKNNLDRISKELTELMEMSGGSIREMIRMERDNIISISKLI